MAVVIKIYFVQLFLHVSVKFVSWSLFFIVCCLAASPQ